MADRYSTECPLPKSSLAMQWVKNVFPTPVSP